MYPSGILILASALRHRGISCTILDSTLSEKQIPIKEREELIKKTIIGISPKVVCFSASHIELDEVLRMKNSLISLNVNTKVIVGGSQPTYRPSDFIDNGFDFVCAGEGEKTLYSFVQEAKKTSSDWATIDGLLWKREGKVITNTPQSPLTEEELNEYPPPAYDLIDKRYFKANAGIVRGVPLRGAMILTTRGCPYNCSFCGCNLIFGRKLRFKSEVNIEREIQLLKNNYGVEGIWIIDDTFTVNKNHLITVCNLLKKYGIVWGCQSRVNTIDEEMIRVMKQSGCMQIDFGVESGSQRLLDDIINKGTKIAQIKRAFELSRKYGIRTLANFMIGLPTETKEELQLSVALARELKADVYIFSIATPLPGTRLYDMIGVPISYKEYGQLNWAGSEITNRFNKSEIENLVQTRLSLQKEFYVKSLIRSVVAWQNIFFFIKSKWKMEKIACLFHYAKRAFSKKITK
jgi:radical SAM superfamily enzyme YgiQ (UPF0313 family)